MINAGTDVGLPYNGSAPDIGYSESNYGARTEKALKGNGVVQIHNGKILGNGQ